ncbi:hypothetical protein GKC29_14875 [Micromonospora sp. WMMC415]|uniref:hypothetical protein n=1 Tax=Micromonospora sp. WMMC415 TaxID=2675222 RepID=UPI0012B447F0|nr:hypothetical protein [Micromonospora sp. WMMC415]QGN48001.1 hypothetical protein GKC29_14875 [Micromonospora sp. WMMC415]
MTNTMQQCVVASGRPSAQLALTAHPHRHSEPLAALAVSPGQAVTIVHTDRRENAVVLAQPAVTGTVRVLVDGHARSLRADVAAVPVIDPATALGLAQQAVAWALAAQHTAADRARALAEELDEQRRLHVRRLAEIRSYAIDRHRDGDICRDGLDKFLAHFDLDPYDPRHRVRFTISGSFDVTPEDGRDAGDTEYDVREYLRIGTDQVDGVDEDTLTFDVTVNGVEARGE